MIAISVESLTKIGIIVAAACAIIVTIDWIIDRRLRREFMRNNPGWPR